MILEESIIEVVKEDPKITNKELSRIFNLSERQIKRYIADMVKSGLLMSRKKYLTYDFGKILTIRTLSVCNIKKQNQQQK